ncbi:hypothetical protein HDU99_002595, partial [Rhizoclosmatium hyalinum]
MTTYTAQELSDLETCSANCFSIYAKTTIGSPSDPIYGMKVGSGKAFLFHTDPSASPSTLLSEYTSNSPAIAWWIGPSTSSNPTHIESLKSTLTSSGFTLQQDNASKMQIMALKLPSNLYTITLPPTLSIKESITHEDLRTKVHTEVLAFCDGEFDEDTFETDLKGYASKPFGPGTQWRHYTASFTNTDGTVEHVATASLSIHGSAAFVSAVGVVPSARGMGIAKALTRFCMNVAMTECHGVTVVGLRPEDEHIVGLYAKMGYEPVFVTDVM